MMRAVEKGDVLREGGDINTGMGMEVEVAAANPSSIFVSSSNNRNGSTITCETTLNWNTSAEETGFCFWPFQEPMDRLIQDHNKEFIRNNMLRQEKVFKEQVHELHRLYKVQIALMSELNKQLRSHPTNTATSSMDFSDTRSSFMSSQSPPFREKHGSITHPSSDNMHCATSSVRKERSFRLQNGFNLELGENRLGINHVPTLNSSNRTVNYDACIQSCNPSESEDSDLELTLSIGNNAKTEKSRQRTHSNHDLRPDRSSSLQARQHSAIQQGKDAAFTSEMYKSFHGYFKF